MDVVQGLVIFYLFLGGLAAFTRYRDSSAQRAVTAAEKDARELTAGSGIEVGITFDVQKNIDPGSRSGAFIAEASASPDCSGDELSIAVGVDRWRRLLETIPEAAAVARGEFELVRGSIAVIQSYESPPIREAVLKQAKQAIEEARRASVWVRAVPAALFDWVEGADGSDAIWALRILRSRFAGDPSQVASVEFCRTADDPNLRGEVAKWEGDRATVRRLLLDRPAVATDVGHWGWALRWHDDDPDRAELERRAVEHHDVTIARAGLMGLEARTESPSLASLAGALDRAKTDPLRILLITALGKLNDPGIVQVLSRTPGSSKFCRGPRARRLSEKPPAGPSRGAARPSSPVASSWSRRREVPWQSPRRTAGSR